MRVHFVGCVRLTADLTHCAHRIVILEPSHLGGAIQDIAHLSRTRFVRQVAGIWRPLRLLAIGAIFIAFYAAYSDVDASMLIIACACVALLISRVLHSLRWPRFDRYIALISPVGPPDGWVSMATSDSPSYVIWSASRPTIEKWIEGRQSRGHRFAAARSQLATPGMYRVLNAKDGLPNQSGRALIRDMSEVSLTDFVTITDELGELLTRAECQVVRETGILPDWYWRSISEAYVRAR